MARLTAKFDSRSAVKNVGDNERYAGAQEDPFSHLLKSKFKQSWISPANKKPQLTINEEVTSTNKTPRAIKSGANFEEDDNISVDLSAADEENSTMCDEELFEMLACKHRF